MNASIVASYVYYLIGTIHLKTSCNAAAPRQMASAMMMCCVVPSTQPMDQLVKNLSSSRLQLPTPTPCAPYIYRARNITRMRKPQSWCLEYITQWRAPLKITQSGAKRRSAARCVRVHPCLTAKVVFFTLFFSEKSLPPKLYAFQSEPVSHLI